MRPNTPRVRSSGSRVRASATNPAWMSLSGTAVPIRLMWAVVKRRSGWQHGVDPPGPLNLGAGADARKAAAPTRACEAGHRPHRDPAQIDTRAGFGLP